MANFQPLAVVLCNGCDGSQRIVALSFSGANRRGYCGDLRGDCCPLWTASRTAASDKHHWDDYQHYILWAGRDWRLYECNTSRLLRGHHKPWPPLRPSLCGQMGLHHRPTNAIIGSEFAGDTSNSSPLAHRPNHSRLEPRDLGPDLRFTTRNMYERAGFNEQVQR